MRQRKENKKPTERQNTKAETTAKKNPVKTRALFVLKKRKKKRKQRSEKGRQQDYINNILKHPHSKP